ncbi:MAG: SpoIIE family protein phosphatase, partial [Myxococcales bacterium]|nr:SpoIIE family protein phosphatase [Myxococcales bacterium]
LVTFTDGVTEAMNPVRELYSDARYQELLTQMPNATAQEVLDATYKSVRAFAAGAEQNDDITVLILRHDPEVS